MDIFEKCYRPSAADEIREKGIYPYFHALESRQDTEVIMEGKRRIMLGSNNYLGLTTDPEIIEAGIRAFEQYGSGCSGSRFLNGNLDLHVELERELADFAGKEDALVFSTGFQTNLGVVSTLVGRGDYVVCDVEDHASIYCAAQMSFGKMLRYRHNDMEMLERRLASVPDDAGCLVVVDGVFSTLGDFADLPSICRLARKYGAAVMVDDAHGLGVVGKGGRGTASHFGLDEDVDVIMGTFSKSLASLGGFVAGRREVVDYLRHSSPPFVFSAALTPACAATALAALRHLRAHPELPERLRGVSDFARRAFAKHGIQLADSSRNGITPILSIPTGGTRETCVVAKKMFDGGVFVNPFVPPGVPEGHALIRTSFMATHTPDLVEAAADVIAEALGC
jgi:8-amino-7-oxononanoate synthase